MMHSSELIQPSQKLSSPVREAFQSLKLVKVKLDKFFHESFLRHKPCVNGIGQERRLTSPRRLFTALAIFLGLSTSCFSQAKSEIKNYEIVILGMKVGNMVANKVSDSDSLLYKVDSQVKFWFFGTVELKFKTISHFIGGKLIKARSDSKTNRGDFSSKIDWNGNSYSVKALSYEYENSKPLKGPLSWCSTKMFFHEPTDKELFVSEVYGVSGSIKKIENGVYELELDGKRNRYYYQSGVLEKIVIENPIKNYQVRLVK
jgi:hypothetical protein